MRKNKFWALDVPDLHPLGFQHCGDRKIRLYDGGDGGGGGGSDADAAAAAASLGLDTGTAGTATGADIGSSPDASGGIDLGSFADIAAADAASAQAAAEAVADAVGMSGFESTGFLGASPAEALSIAQEIMGINPAEAAMMASQGQLSTGQGLTQSELGLLSELGLGSMAISDNQTVDQALASFAVHGFINQHIGSIMGAIGGPVVGAVVSASNALAQGNSAQSVIGQIAASIVGTVISNVTGLPVSAQTVTALANGNIGQAALGMGIAAVSQATGLPQGAVAAAVNGNYGAAVANTVTAAVIGETAQAFGGPLGGVVSQAIGQSQATQGASQSIANAINNTSFAQELGNATASLSQSIASVNIGVPGGIDNVASAINTGTVPLSIDLGAAGTLTIAAPIDTSPATGSDMAGAQDALANTQLQVQYKIGGAAGLEAYLEKAAKANDSSVFTNVWTNLSRDLAPYQKPPTTPVKTTAEFEAAEKKVAALRLYEEQTGQTASQATLDAIFNAQDPLTFADRLYTTEAEAKDIWRATVGTEPTEYDLLGLIGLDTGQVTSQVQGIADDRSSVSSEELDEFLRDIGKGQITLTPEEQMDLLGGSEVAARNAIVGKYNAFVEDKNTTLGSEAEEFWKKAGLDPAFMTMDDLAMMLKGNEASAETYAQRLADVRETTFKPVDDFAKQAAVEYAAMKAGYNTYEYGGKTYTVSKNDIAASADGRVLSEYTRIVDGALKVNGVDPNTLTEQQRQDLMTAAYRQYGNDINQLRAASAQDFINGNTQTIQQFVDNQSTADFKFVVAGNLPVYAGSSQDLKGYASDYIPTSLTFATESQIDSGKATKINLPNGRVAWVVNKPASEVDLSDITLGSLQGQDPWATDPEAALLTYSQFDTKQLGGAKELVINSAKAAVDLIQNIEAGTGGFVSITPEGKSTLIDVVATTAKAGGNVVKNFSDLIWATGLVERDNVAGATANALIKYSDSILSTDAKTQQDNILKAINSADTLKGKYDALVTASKANPWGAALIAGGELVEEIPTLLAGGAVGKVAAGIWGKSVGFAAARGSDAALSAGESAGVGYAETYDNIIKAGGSAQYAASQAAKSAFQAAAITFGSDLVGDAALVKKFMGDLKDLSVGQLTKVGAKQFVTEGFEEGLQNISTQYNSFGTVDMNQAMNAFTIGSVLGVTTTAGILGPGAINYNAQVALGLNGEGVTLQQVLDGTVQVAPGSFDINAVPITIGGASVSLGDFTKVVDTSLSDPNFSLTSYKTNLEGLAQIDYGGAGLSDIALAVTLAPDANTLTTQLQNMGLDFGTVLNIADTKFDDAITTRDEAGSLTGTGRVIGTDPNTGEALVQLPDGSVTVVTNPGAEVGQTINVAPPVTENQVKQIVNEAIGNIQFPAGITTEDVTKAITDFAKANPGLSAQDVASQVNKIVFGTPPKPTTTDITRALQLATSGKYDAKYDVNGDGRVTLRDVTTIQRVISTGDTSGLAADSFWKTPAGGLVQQIQANVDKSIKDAIAGIQFPEGLTTEDVTKAITDYMAANPGLSATDVTNAITSELAKLPASLSSTDVKDAIDSALTDYATKTDITNAIANIQFPEGVTKEEAEKIVSDAIGKIKFPASLTEEQVGKIVADGISKIEFPQGITEKDVKDVVETATKDLATKADIETAIAGIKFPAGITKEDVAAEIKKYAEVNPGLSTLDVTNAVAEELKKLPAYATPADVTTALDTALKDYATKTYIDDAIKGIEFPQGITKEDVAAEIKAFADANPGLSLDQVTTAITTELGKLPAYATPDDVTTALDAALAGYATQANVDAATKTLQEAIDAAQAGNTTRFNEIDQAIQDLRDAGLTEDQVKSVVDASAEGLSTQFKDALAAAVTGNTEALGTLKTDLETKIGDVQSALETALGEQGTAFGEQVTALMEQGQSYQEAVNTAFADLGTDIGSLGEDVATKLAGLETALGERIGGLESQLGDVETRLAEAIQTAKDIGLEGDQALESAINSVAADLGTTKDALLEQIGATEETLRSDFATELGAVREELSGVEGRLAEAIEAAKTVGLEGDAALDAAIQLVASDLGTTKEALLSQLGTTEQALREDFATQLAGVTTELGNVESRLTGAIATAEAAGLSRDQAIEAALNTVAADLGTTKEGLLSQLGTVESTLRSEIEASQAALGEQVAGVETRLTEAIAAAEAAGLSRDEAIETALNQVATDLGTTKEDLLGQLGTVESGLRGEIEASQAALGEQITGVESRLTEAIADAEALGLTRDQAIQAAVDAVAADLGTTREDLLAQLGTTEATLRADLEAGLGLVGEQLTGVETRLKEAIDTAEAAGLSRDEAIQSAVDSVAADLGTTREDLLLQIGATETTLRSDLEAGLGLVSEQVADVEQRLSDAIQDAKDTGLAGDAALQAAIDSVAGDLGTTREDLLSQLGTTEEALRTDFATQLGEVTTELGNVETRLTEAIAAAEAAGLSRDQAIETALNTVAADLGTTKEDLLGQLGTVESALRSEIEASQAALGEQLTDVETRLKGAIADAEAAGLSRDEAIQSAVDEVASDLGTTREALLEQIGATETTLRADLEAGLGLVGEQVAGVEQRLTEAIAAAEAAGLSRDEAIQAGLDAVASDLGTTREDLLTQLGTTEEALRTEFTSGLAGVETALGEAKQAILDQMAAYEAAGIERDQALDLAITGVAQDLGTTKDDILSRLGTTEEALRTEFQAGQEALGEQLTGVEGRLTQAIAEAEAAGLSRDEAIQAAVDAVAADLGTTREGLLAQLGTTEEALRTEFQTGQATLGEQISTGIGGLQTALAEAEARINERAAEYEAAGLSRDQALQTAISDVAAQLGTTAQNLEQQLFAAQTALGEQITGVQTGLQQQIQDVATVLGKPAQAVTQADIDLVNQMIQGQVQTDLTYDANQDGVIDQSDIAFLTSITTGTEPPEWPAGTRWAPTGVYGQIAGLGADLTRQLEEQELARQAAAEEAERAAQGRFQQQQQQQRVQQFMGMLTQPGALQQKVQVKAPEVMKLEQLYGGLYDPAASVFRTPQQEQFFFSPYGMYADGGEVTEDELLAIVRG